MYTQLKKILRDNRLSLSPPCSRWFRKLAFLFNFYAKESIAWLFPLTYVLHLCEEYWGGEGFPIWISRMAGVSFTNQEFLVLNTFALVFMTVGASLIFKYDWRWLLIALGGVVFINGTLHLVFSIVTRSYSPGLISGVLCWMPLGLFSIYRQWSHASRRSFFIGVFLALGLHTLVSLLMLYA